MLERSQCGKFKNIFCTQTVYTNSLNMKRLVAKFKGYWGLNTYLTTFTFSTHQSPWDVCQNTMMDKLKHTKNI